MRYGKASEPLRYEPSPWYDELRARLIARPRPGDLENPHTEPLPDDVSVRGMRGKIRSAPRPLLSPSAFFGPPRPPARPTGFAARKAGA